MPECNPASNQTGTHPKNSVFMHGITLSRWTMSYFATALVALLTALGLMVAGNGYPASDSRLRQTRSLMIDPEWCCNIIDHGFACGVSFDASYAARSLITDTPSGRACVSLRTSNPALEQRFNALLHRLTRRLPGGTS